MHTMSVNGVQRAKYVAGKLLEQGVTFSCARSPAFVKESYLFVVQDDNAGILQQAVTGSYDAYL